MEPRKIAFILNPSAGKKRKLNLEEFIRDYFHLKQYKIFNSFSIARFEDIKREIISEGYTDIIACGGDGTVNRVAAFACEHNFRLGILPLGSGNGLARSVGISMDLQKALRQIEYGKTKRIDAGILNERMFFCAAGMGFDAHIASLFEKSTGRGLWGYITLIWKEFFSYKNEEYNLIIDNRKINHRAFMIACCNSGQYGNDFYVAPTASMTDGKITISVIRSFSWIQIPYILWKVLQRKAHLHSKVETFHADKISITRQARGQVHIDGEPFETEAEILLQVRPLALEIICG
jgi:diacylglycerol kinase (ATP)